MTCPYQPMTPKRQTILHLSWAEVDAIRKGHELVLYMPDKEIIRISMTKPSRPVSRQKESTK